MPIRFRCRYHPEYQNLYDTLKAGLDRNEGYLDALLDQQGKKYPIVFGTALLAANSNRGTELLKSTTLTVTQLYLNGLKQMGVQGVSINIAYPLFTPSFPRYNDYVTFYKKVAQMVRDLKMKLEIAATIIFSDTPFTGVKADFAGLTFSKYKTEQRQMVTSILTQLHPDYLTIVGEPDTEANLTHLKELTDVSKVTDLIKFVLNGLSRGKTKVGAGTGTWSPSTYAKSYAMNTSLDYISVHIYPNNNTTLANVLAMINWAEKYKKKLIMDEAWLYKTSPQQDAGKAFSTNVAAAPEIYGRDTFSFWAPLDQQFLRIIAKLASVKQIEYVSPFWSTCFFTYINYDSTTSTLSYPRLSAQANLAAYQNLLSGTLSPTGTYYKQLIAQYSAGK